MKGEGRAFTVKLCFPQESGHLHLLNKRGEPDWLFSKNEWWNPDETLIYHLSG